MTVLRAHDLGENIPYDAGMSAMAIAARSVDECPTLLLLEHAPVITTTRSHGMASLLVDETELSRREIAHFEASRGGDATFHGPGQLVGYPVIRLPKIDDSVDLGGYVRALESGLMAALRTFGLDDAHREPGLTGVWVGPIGDDAEKIASIGVGVSPRGITRHGFALNVDIALEKYLATLVPCGLRSRTMTTMKLRLGARTPSMNEIKSVVTAEMSRALGFEGAPFLSDTRGNASFNGAHHG